MTADKKMDKESAKKKKENLIAYLRGLDSLVVAFSGGVDSTFLLAVAHEVLGGKALAATASSKTYPIREQDEAVQFAKERGIRHFVFPSEEIEIPGFSSNPPDRCYHCKKCLSQNLVKIAEEQGIRYAAHAANVDDLGDYRPGMDAAREMGIIAPLLEVKLNKEEIRFLSKEMGLPTWNKPSMACLASRFPYGDSITEEKLTMVDQAEAFLQNLGFRQYRVRHHGSLARIEVEGEDVERIAGLELREKIVKAFRDIGFLHVALDLEGYSTGRMNRALEIKK